MNSLLQTPLREKKFVESDGCANAISDTMSSCHLTIDPDEKKIELKTTAPNFRILVDRIGLYGKVMKVLAKAEDVTAIKAAAGEDRVAISHLLALGFGESEPSPPAKAVKSPKPKVAGANEPVRLLHQSKALGRKGELRSGCRVPALEAGPATRHHRPLWWRARRNSPARSHPAHRPLPLH